MTKTRRNKYVIATIKSWNIEKAVEMKSAMSDEIAIVTKPEELTSAYLHQIEPRYVFFPHWSWKIPAEIFNKWECVVFHMTDLPYGRGGSPLQNLIERGIYKTKISALKVVAEMDAGPIYLKKDLDISEGSANDILKRAAEIIYKEMIPFIIEKEPGPVPQSGQPTLFKRRNEQQSDLSGITDLNKVYDQIRMLDGEGYPPAFIRLNNIKIEITGAKRTKGAIRAAMQIKMEGKQKI
jgi:methionyl-tRNA formyltransferase